MDNDIGETVYGTNEDSHVMSERVQTLAASIYKEFERMIKNYDENVVKELMPLVVGILESLDQSYVDKQENEVEVELLRDDNEQLLTQYEREKQLRKSSEQKYLEAEDSHEEERKNTQSKVESLESIVRMFELKAKNAQDHISRLDDKEQEMRKEYNKLHERYTELFKTHMDYMERTKMVMGGDRIMEMANTPRGKMGLNLPNLKAVTPVGMYSPADTPVKTGTSPPNINSIMSPARSQDSNTSLKSEMRDLEGNLTKELKDNKNRGIDVGQTTDLVETKERNVGTSDVLAPSLVAETPDLEDIDPSGFEPSRSTPIAGASRGKANESSIFDELALDQDALGEMDDGIDITVSDNFFGMGKEVENLILENTELLATKNALNVVKDDLIAKVDELSSEQEILREEIQSLQAVKTRLKARVSELEEDLKKSKEELEKAKSGKTGENENEEEEVPMAQRKRFTRVEMARVLMERNQYKERLMELQEAVRWTEMIRASREHPELVTAPKKKGSIWNFFGNLVGSSSSSLPQEPPKPKPKKKSYSIPTVI